MVNSSTTSSSSTSTMENHDLGKIIEEELFPAIKGDNGDNDKIYVVRTNKRKRRPQRRRKKQTKVSEDVSSRRESSDSLSEELMVVGDSVYEKQGSFTIRVDELHKKTKKREKKKRQAKLEDGSSGSWQWRKDLESPLVWSDEEGEGEATPEDIFQDWLGIMARIESDLDNRCVFNRSPPLTHVTQFPLTLCIDNVFNHIDHSNRL